MLWEISVLNKIYKTNSFSRLKSRVYNGRKIYVISSNNKFSTVLTELEKGDEIKCKTDEELLIKYYGMKHNSNLYEKSGEFFADLNLYDCILEMVQHNDTSIDRDTAINWIKNLFINLNQENGESQSLDEAIKLNNCLKLRSSLKNAVQSRDTDHSNASLVHIAVENGDMEMIKLLQSYGADIEAQDKEMATPVQYAAQLGKLDIIKYLVDSQGVNLNHREFYSRTALYITTSCGEMDILNYLIERGSDADAPTKLGRSPLNPNYDVKNKWGFNPLETYLITEKGAVALFFIQKQLLGEQIPEQLDLSRQLFLNDN